MRGERSPRRWTRGGASSPSPSSSRSNGRAATSNVPQHDRRWGSNISTQRRERTVLWASCLQTVQSLRRGGSWQANRDCGEQGGGRISGARGGSDAIAGEDGNINSTGSVQVDGGVGSRDDRAEAELQEQLDLLATLTFPNSSIRFEGCWLFPTEGRVVSRLFQGCLHPCTMLNTYISRQ